ncbi:MAG TPA: hypothetical protein VGS80_12755 [Ktedonobacterales bacterium]|nr:hypothetical protein [Ktedonobacterales bacterium]
MTEPTEGEWKAAEALLDAIPEYHLLTRSPTPFWKVQQVAGPLGVTEHIVRNWCERGYIRGAIKYDDPQVGWRIPRSGLIVFLAERVRAQQQQGQHGQDVG